jgi:hypothetical protein
VASSVERIERVVSLADAAEAPIGGAVGTAIRLRGGESVELSVRSLALGVEVRVAAPQALAAALSAGSDRLRARLGRRGVRLRACRVVARGARAAGGVVGGGR